MTDGNRSAEHDGRGEREDAGWKARMHRGMKQIPGKSHLFFFFCFFLKVEFVLWRQ